MRELTLFDGLLDNIDMPPAPKKTKKKAKTQKKQKTADLPVFKDAEFMSAKEKEKVFKVFQRVIKARDINKMTKALYTHLHVHCDFIAHYNIKGFKAVYSGQGFREFIQHFDRNQPNWMREIWVNQDDYKDINIPMADLVTKEAPKIYAELDAKEQQAEIAMACALAEKHGLEVNVPMQEVS